jgi:DNA-binding transcriptional ArsR family regulator
MQSLAHPFHELIGGASGRLLEALRHAPDSGLHVREIARGAGLSLSSLRRELDRLSALGVLSRFSKGNRVHHRLKRHDPFVRLLLAATVALELRHRYFHGMPANRDAEKALVDLCAFVPPDAGLWKEAGDPQFLAGVVVMLAGHSGYDRAAWLALAETLSPGASSVERLEQWHRAHRPDLPRFFSLIDRERRTHARSED